MISLILPTCYFVPVGSIVQSSALFVINLCFTQKSVCPSFHNRSRKYIKKTQKGRVVWYLYNLKSKLNFYTFNSLWKWEPRNSVPNFFQLNFSPPDNVFGLGLSSLSYEIMFMRVNITYIISMVQCKLRFLIFKKYLVWMKE